MLNARLAAPCGDGTLQADAVLDHVQHGKSDVLSTGNFACQFFAVWIREDLRPVEQARLGPDGRCALERLQKHRGPVLAHEAGHQVQIADDLKVGLEVQLEDVLRSREEEAAAPALAAPEGSRTAGGATLPVVEQMHMGVHLRHDGVRHVEQRVQLLQRDVHPQAAVAELVAPAPGVHAAVRRLLHQEHGVQDARHGCRGEQRAPDKAVWRRDVVEQVRRRMPVGRDHADVEHLAGALVRLAEGE